MAEFPSLPLWTDAYVADCGHLGDAEHGRYLQILIQMWRSPKCRIPNDDDWLARRFRRTVEAVRSELRPIIVEFCQVDGNWITQKRLQREWQWCVEKAKKNTAAAKSRWDKEKGQSERTSNRNAPTPTPSKKDSPNGESSSGALPPDQSRPKQTRDRASVLPEGWILPDEWRADALEALRRNNLPDIDLDLAAEEFANYWHSLAGSKARKADWRRTWVNRVLELGKRAKDRGQSNGRNRGPGQGLGDLLGWAGRHGGPVGNGDRDVEPAGAGLGDRPFEDPLG